MRKWLPLITVCLGTFMLLIDVTIVNVALPDMAGDLKTTFGSLQWVVDAYALTLAALVLGTGSIADLVGHRRAYVAGLALFAVSSLVCGLVAELRRADRRPRRAGRRRRGDVRHDLRAAQQQLHRTRPRHRVRHCGARSPVRARPSARSSAACSPRAISWRWIFFVNLPVSVLAIALCVGVLQDAHAPVRSRVDIAGMVTFTAAAAAATYGLIRANEHGWSAPGTWGTLIASAVLLAVFVAVEQRTDHAMLDLGLLRNRSFVGVLLGRPAARPSPPSRPSPTPRSGCSRCSACRRSRPASPACRCRSRRSRVSAAIGRFLHGTPARADHRRRPALHRRRRR